MQSPNPAFLVLYSRIDGKQPVTMRRRLPKELLLSASAKVQGEHSQQSLDAHRWLPG